MLVQGRGQLSLGGLWLCLLAPPGPGSKWWEGEKSFRKEEELRCEGGPFELAY